MKLSKFIKPLKFKALLFNLCNLLKLLSIILLVPIAVSLITSEFNYTLILAIICTASYLIGYFGKFIYEDDLSRKDALIVTALAYLLFSIVTAFAFLPVTNYLNGFFESISGFTTTGLSVLNPDKLPDTLLFLRAYSQWIGGAGIIILTLVLLSGPGTSALKLYSSEFGKENLVGNVKNTGIIVLKIYSILTVAGFILYIISGVNFFDAILLVLSTISTGGFAPHSSSIKHYNFSLIHIFIIIFMIFGATSFSSFYNITKKGIKGFFENLQLKMLFGIILIFSFLFFASYNFNSEKILSSIFQSVSAATTTGFSVEKTSGIPIQTKLMTIFLMVIGGTSASTAGGIKIIRFLLVIFLLRWMVLKLFLPDEAKVPVKIKDITFSDNDIKKIFGFISIYMLLIFLSSLIFVFYKYGVINSVFECTSALGTVGLSTGITSPEMPGILKVVLIINMWAGRVEIFPVLALFYPRIWIPERS